MDEQASEASETWEDAQEVLWQGRFQRPRSSPLARLLVPVAVVHRAVESTFEWLQAALWLELIEGERQSPLAVAVGAVVFPGLALLTFHLDEAARLLILFVASCWALEQGVEWLRLRRGWADEPVDIQLSRALDDQIEWRQSAPGQRRHQVHFAFTWELAGVWLIRAPVELGAFRGRHGLAWQVHVTLRSGQSLLVGQSFDLEESLEQGQAVAQALGLELRIADSEGDHYLAASPGYERAIDSRRDGVWVDSHRLRLATRLRLRHVMALVREVLARSGLLLFALILAGVLERSGRFVNFFLGRRLGLPATDLFIDLSPRGVAGFFLPQTDGLTLVELGIALLLVVYQGFRLLRRKRLWVEEEKVHVAPASGTHNGIELSRLDLLLLSRQPDPRILLAGGEGSTELAGFVEERQARAFLREAQAVLARARETSPLPGLPGESEPRDPRVDEPALNPPPPPP